MSHAGQHLELEALGRWWDDIPRPEWPAGIEDDITIDFQGPHGDRRQELVFIGQFDNLDGFLIEDALDACLLTDDEMKTYETLKAEGDTVLRQHFYKQ
jgi:hypothetical protein